MKCEERLCAGDDAGCLTVCDADLGFEGTSCLTATPHISEFARDYRAFRVILILTLSEPCAGEENPRVPFIVWFLFV